MLPVCLCVCVPVNPLYQLLNALINFYEILYECHGAGTNLNGVREKSLPSVCMAVCVFPCH
jgi:hypothetical protein